MPCSIDTNRIKTVYSKYCDAGMLCKGWCCNIRLRYLLRFIGGILTIVSPCIVPVLPFVFSRADQPFRRSGLPLLAGRALTFTALASVATLAGVADGAGRGASKKSKLGLSAAESLMDDFIRLRGRFEVSVFGLLSVGRGQGIDETVERGKVATVAALDGLLNAVIARD